MMSWNKEGNTWGNISLVYGLSFMLSGLKPRAFTIFNDPFAKLMFDWMTEILTVRTEQNQ